MGNVFLGVDIGTSYSKGVLVRSDGSVLARADRGHDVSMPQPGWVEQDAESIWWRDFVAICTELLPQADGPIAGVATSGLGPTLLLIDSSGRPLRPAILYGVDTRSVNEIGELTRRYGAEAILGRCGSALTSQAVGPKMLWVRRHEPAVWGRARRFLMVNSYLVHRLTGEYALDHHSASQCDPLYDVAKNQWIDDWSRDIAPGLEMPRLLWADEVAGTVTGTAAIETGIPTGTPVAMGSIDAWAEATSVGVRRPGDAMLMYGTALTLVSMVSPLRPLPAMWGVVGPFQGTWTLAGGVTTSGALTKWFRGLTGGPSFERLFDEARAVPVGSEGLVVLPYFSGERNPFFDPLARGVICGLTLSHGRGHLFRALLEGCAFAVRHMLETVVEAEGHPSRIVAVGGGTRDPLWPQIVSDVIGREQELPRETVGASYGDAFFAAVATKYVPRDADWNVPTAIIRPQASSAAVYAEMYEVFRGLYPATRPQVHALANLVGRDLDRRRDSGGGSVA